MLECWWAHTTIWLTCFLAVRQRNLLRLLYYTYSQRTYSKLWWTERFDAQYELGNKKKESVSHLKPNKVKSVITLYLPVGELWLSVLRMPHRQHATHYLRVTFRYGISVWGVSSQGNLNRAHSSIKSLRVFGLGQCGEAAEGYLLNGSCSELQIFMDVIVMASTRSLARKENFTGHGPFPCPSIK